MFCAEKDAAKTRFTSLPLHTIVCLLLAASPAAALTGGDILDKMNTDQRASYLAGSVEMAAFLSVNEGNAERAKCIMDWYRDKNGIDAVVDMLAQYKEKQALPVLQVLIKRACGD